MLTFDLMMIIYEITVIFLLAIECWLIYIFSKEHGLLLDVLKHNVVEIKKIIRGETPK
jgi:hypothetical protein